MVMHRLDLDISKCVAKEVKLLIQAITLGDGNYLLGSGMIQSLTDDTETR